MLLRNLESLVHVSHRGPTRDPEPNVVSLVVENIRDSVDRAADEPLPPMPDMPENYVSGPVTDMDRAPGAHRFNESTGLIHVSALVDLCPRAYALARQHDVVMHTSVTGAMRIVWEMGLALEVHIIRQMERSFGDFAIRRDMTLVDEEYGIVGRPDVMVDLPGDAWEAVVEIKSMNAEQFGRLNQPLANHLLQALLYRWLAERAGYPVHDNVILLYVAKDYVRGGVYKEFHVDHRDVACQNMLNRALSLALELKQAMDRNGLPERRICTTTNCSRARGCRVATLCFNLPAEAT